MIEAAVTQSIVVNASPAKVWGALTSPEIIRQYMFGTEAHSLWKEGSPIYFRGEWQGSKYEDKGTILRFDPKRILQYSYWSNFTGLKDVPENYSTVTWELTPEENAVKLSVSQEKFATEEARQHSETAWEGVLKTLKEILEA